MDVVEILSPEDFYRDAHQMIYSAISGLFTRNEPIDLVTLANILKERKHLEKVGGAAYLAQLVNDIPLAVNPQHHAKIVHEKASLRRLIHKANEITKRCFEDQGNVDEVIDFAENAVFEISDDKIKQSFHPISSIIDHNIDDLEERQANQSLMTGVPTGFSRIDALTSGLQGSDLIILAARPAMGKTAFA
jgi:replicative DNA helicase